MDTSTPLPDAEPQFAAAAAAQAVPSVMPSAQADTVPAAAAAATTTLSEAANPAVSGLAPEAWSHIQSQAMQLPREVHPPSVALVS